MTEKYNEKAYTATVKKTVEMVEFNFGGDGYRTVDYSIVENNDSKFVVDITIADSHGEVFSLSRDPFKKSFNSVEEAVEWVQEEEPAWSSFSITTDVYTEAGEEIKFQKVA